MSASSEFLFVLGLPSATVEAQQVVDEMVRRSPNSALLWERAGLPIDALHGGLYDLDRVPHIATLNTSHESKIRQIVGSSTSITRLPAAIPALFFDHAQMPRQPTSPFAAFIGRTYPAKGAGRLVRVWQRQVYPMTKLPLHLYLVDSEAPIASALRTDVSTVRRLSKPRDRARVMRDALMVVFPAIHDHLPQALLETMAAGGLCVTTDIPGHEYVQHRQTGLRIDVEMADLAPIACDVQRNEYRYASLRERASIICRTDHSEAAAAAALSRLVDGVR